MTRWFLVLMAAALLVGAAFAQDIDKQVQANPQVQALLKAKAARLDAMAAAIRAVQVQAEMDARKFDAMLQKLVAQVRAQLAAKAAKAAEAKATAKVDKPEKDEPVAMPAPK